jgi:hypothetical protein
LRMKKRRATDERARTWKKAALQTKTSTALNIPTQGGRHPKLFRPLRAADILTSTTDLIRLQKQLKIVLKENFEFRSTRNGTRVITRSMADFQSVKSHFVANNLSYYSFYPKSEKSMKPQSL